MTLVMERALPGQALLLSELAFRSKAYWGYSSDFMYACRDELSYSQQELSNHHAYALKDKDRVIGFYILKLLSIHVAELDALFVDIDEIGKGHGRKLLNHAKGIAKNLAVSKMIIQGDPNAEKFYLAAGAVRIGEKESMSIPGRFLPMFEIDLRGPFYWSS